MQSIEGISAGPSSRRRREAFGLLLPIIVRYDAYMKPHLRTLRRLSLTLCIATAAPYAARAQDGTPNATAENLDAETLGAPISSIVVRDADVFVANKKGLFRASIDEKRWNRLPVPERMPVSGAFGRLPKDSKHLFFHSYGVDPVNRKSDHGLYHSTDSGQTWRLISNDYDFQKVHLHRDGSLYAIVLRTYEETDKKWFRWSIVRSATLDAPLKWEDITGNIERGMRLYDIIDDPVHPELVRLRGSSVRGYILHADDKNYRWQITADLNSRHRTDSDEAFLGFEASAYKVLYLYRATLANYFDHPFGDRPELHALILETKSNSFTFAKDEPKKVPVSIRFLQDEQKVTIPDVRDALDSWAMRVITPGGKRVEVLPRGHQLVWRDSKKRAEYRAREPIRSVELSREHPYERTIDLGKLADFSHPGEYRLRLSYHSDWLAEGDEWSGSFCSDTLTITIR